MNGLHPFPAADSEIRENWRVVSEVLDELYFELFLEPGMGGLYGTAAKVVITAGVPRANAIELPDAVTGIWLLALPVRDRFSRLSYQLDVDYTSPVAGVANFTLQADLFLTTPGGNLQTDPTITVQAPAPGPANINDEKRVTLTAPITTLVSPLYRHMRFRLIRLGAADANNNPLHVLGAYLRLYGA